MFTDINTAHERTGWSNKRACLWRAAAPTRGCLMPSSVPCGQTCTEKHDLREEVSATSDAHAHTQGS
jgi:hypothetical protein